ncbi:MAG TPA: hypothetical protein VMH49_02555, partial [Thermoplasmata archaeon]|nr:hypothetical protein [Thermoplasmata archaeon]
MPAERFRGPIEMFWHGVGYAVSWSANELRGSRELDGQRREFIVQVSEPARGTVAIRCRVTFVGRPTQTRPNEIYDPGALTDMLGSALARGFG